MGFYKGILHNTNFNFTKVLNIADSVPIQGSEFTAANFIFNFAFMYTKEQILNFISESKPLLQTKFHIKKIGLFGSFARGEQSNNSDIDLIIEFEENTENLFDLKIAIKEYFKNALNLNVDICREKYIKSVYKARILKETVYVD